jgi:hypothetical protein
MIKGINKMSGGIGKKELSRKEIAASANNAQRVVASETEKLYKLRSTTKALFFFVVPLE